MWLGDAECVSPEGFRAALGRLHPAFTRRTQQDAQFLLYVPSALHEALRKYRRTRSCEKKPTQRCLRKVTPSETSIISQLFEGQLSYSIVCPKCESCTYKSEAFTVLSLPIPSEHECSLQNHSGGLDSGHHTAFCRNAATQARYSFDDASIQAATAYLLLNSCQPFSRPVRKRQSAAQAGP